MCFLHVGVHTPTLCELVITELALDPLYLEVHGVYVPVQHVHAAVRFGADVAVDGGFCRYLSGSEGPVAVVHREGT